MMTLFKSLVHPRLDYGSQLWSPHLVKNIDQLEKNQRSFTKHITGMQSLEYSERLASLKLYSLQRRRERYCIIYVWKIIEGLVPNFSKPIVCSYSERRGRSCIISLDSATAWTLETFYNGGHRVRTWLPIRCCRTTTSITSK